MLKEGWRKNTSSSSTDFPDLEKAIICSKCKNWRFKDKYSAVPWAWLNKIMTKQDLKSEEFWCLKYYYKAPIFHVEGRLWFYKGSETHR